MSYIISFSNNKKHESIRRDVVFLRTEQKGLTVHPEERSGEGGARDRPGPLAACPEELVALLDQPRWVGTEGAGR